MTNNDDANEDQTTVSGMFYIVYPMLEKHEPTHLY